MRTSRFLSALIIAALAACSGGANSSLPTSTSSEMQQSIPRRVIDTSGATRAILYTKEVEQSGRVSNEVSGPSGIRTQSTSSNLIYHSGGLIQPAPKIYVVFWGSSWSSAAGDPYHVQTYLKNFLSALGGSAWLSTVKQYGQPAAPYVGNAAGGFAGSWNDTSAIPNLDRSNSSYQGYLAAEAQRAAAHFGNKTVDASYVIALPHGTNVYQFAGSCGAICYFIGAYCAWHSTATYNGGTIAYTNLPYQPDAGPSCGAGSVNGSTAHNDGVSIVEGHEQAETETDPHLNAWYDSSDSEIGDKCAWTNLQDQSFGGTTLGVNKFPTQPLWSNKVSGCVQ